MLRRILFLGVLAFQPANAERAPNRNGLTLSPAERARLTIAPVKVMPFSETLKLPGKVMLDEHRVARIGPSISGRVVEIKAFNGQTVQEGQTLALLNSTELSNAQAAYLKASTRIGLQRMNVERARRLFREGIISEATLKEREAGLAEAEVEMRAASDQLAIMGMSAAALKKLAESRQIDSLTPITATLSGTIIDRHISVGSIAEISDELFTVADLSHVWVVADAPEREAHQVRVGTRVEVNIPALPNPRFIGKIVLIADVVNPDTRTVTMRMEVDNLQRRIKPEMLATMFIRHPSQNTLMIPAGAVLREEDKDHVFVETSADHLELREVVLDKDIDGRRKVISGLKPGEPIVVEGAFHLNNIRHLKDME